MECKNIIAALVKAQLEIKPPAKDKVGQYKNKYASLDAIYNSCRTILAENGLILSHTVESDGGAFHLVTTLYHTSGETMQNKFPMHMDKSGIQGIAAARTYACRYATANLLALPCEEDDDGEQAQKIQEKEESREEKVSTITFKEALALQEVIDTEIAPFDPHYKQKALDKFSVKGLNHLRPDQRDALQRNITAKIKEIKKAV